MERDSKITVVGFVDASCVSTYSFVHLYTPLLSANATKIYAYLIFKLNTSVQLSTVLHHFSTTISEFDKSLKLLNGLNLVQTYTNDGEIYLKIIDPLPLLQFFQNAFFCELLRNKIGEHLFDQYLAKTKVIIGNDFTNTSASFFEVFGKIDGFDTQIKNSRTEIETNFDWEVFLSRFNAEYIRKQTLNAYKDLIISKAFSNNLSESEIADFVLRAYDTTSHEINEQMLIRSINNSRMAAAPLTSQEVKQSLGGNVNGRLEALAQIFEATHPRAILKGRFGNVSHSDQRVIEMLLVRFNFTFGVANVIIDYALSVNDNKLVSAYCETIASQLYRKKFTTAQETMEHFKRQKAELHVKKENKFVKNKKPKTNQVMHDWDSE